MNRVLVVDDHLDDRSLLAEFLRQQGFRVFMASDGLDGLAKARVVRPDLILMDINMPNCDGLTACRKLKCDPATSAVPLIFLTASTQPEERVAGLEAGAIDYIAKPFHFEEVRLRIAIHLRLDSIAHDSESNVGIHPLNQEATNIDLALFRQVKAIVLANFADELDVETLAARAGTSPRRLSLALKRCIGLTVFDYIREERLKESRRLLLESNSDIVTIARSVGYTNGANFATAFKTRFGISPSVLRRGNNGANEALINP
ncbi:Alkaline phosphatase synthesis transcriptional regulatory protein PhoP (plasmid) [Burkholderia glumae]|uniref:response regulator transcription factor n=1 Tax=Burkholderia glumae TaxID=337 RepID=UPI0013741754|nr:response regulator [Burkholderia glumae]MCR1770810.1 response regulator [Burkholderia glumae]QHP95053.1 response regulator transcription factor [Burkholderia glumae]QKM51909.1 Alkaline phosphatase synthesis transcriptional regulatory protein PhoP [Burkholderia glumae]